MKLGRREFLHLAAGAVATATAVPSMVRGQGQALKRRPARDRLEEALSRIADPKGEGARACLTVYTQVARDAADAADARARAGISLGPLDGAIGSDTGGSVRVPAALCGVVGFKPSKRRVPTEGAFPLSYTLDSIGPLARSVADCADADAAMSGGEATTLEPAALQGLRIGIAQGLPLRGLDEVVASRLFDAVNELGRVGVQLSPELFPQFDDMVRANARGSIAVAEAYAIHRERLATRGAEFDPFVRSRVERGREISAADYIVLIRDRAAMVRAMDTRLADLDALVLPTCAIAAPTIAECRNPESALTRNQMALRNAAIVNFFDLCAISLPLPRGDGLPVGLMLAARNGQDRRLLQIAAAMEKLFGA